MLREIVLDTETTGLSHRTGDRLIEIACVELVNRIPTGRELHHLINPGDREIHPDAVEIHGITNESLKDKPRFESIADRLIEFIGDSPLVIHNASFDIGFLNAELDRLGRPAISMDRVVDTLALARRRHPAGPNSLDALCKRYRVDASDRTKHGALIDSLLLAAVYVELLGERQAALGLADEKDPASPQRARTRKRAAKARTIALPLRIKDSDVARFEIFVDTLGPDPLWRLFRPKLES